MSKLIDGAKEFRDDSAPDGEEGSFVDRSVETPLPPGTSKYLFPYNKENTAWFFWCPGCKSHHVINNTWRITSWNPLVVSPSILVTAPPTPYRCHSFIVGDKIQFLTDCSHELKGKTVPLELPKTGLEIS